MKLNYKKEVFKNSQKEERKIESNKTIWALLNEFSLTHVMKRSPNSNLNISTKKTKVDPLSANAIAISPISSSASGKKTEFPVLSDTFDYVSVPVSVPSSITNSTNPWDQKVRQLIILLVQVKNEMSILTESHDKFRKLLKEAEEAPELFRKAPIFSVTFIVYRKVLLKLISRQFTSSFKSKDNPLICVLSARLLGISFSEVIEWPLEFIQVESFLILKVFIEDFVEDRLWVDNPACSLLTRHIQFSLGLIQEETSVLHYNSSKAIHDFIKKVVTFCAAEKGTKKKSFIRALQLGCIVPELCLLAATDVQEWLNSPLTVKLAKELLTSIAAHAKSLAILTKLVDIKTKPNFEEKLIESIETIMLHNSERNKQNLNIFASHFANLVLMKKNSMYFVKALSKFPREFASALLAEFQSSSCEIGNLFDFISKASKVLSSSEFLLFLSDSTEYSIIHRFLILLSLLRDDLVLLKKLQKKLIDTRDSKTMIYSIFPLKMEPEFHHVNYSLIFSYSLNLNGNLLDNPPPK